jgi:hypothetical protein
MEINSIREALKRTREKQDDVVYKSFEKLGIIIDEGCESDEQSNHSCSVCKKTLISAHLLSLHVIEAHDTFFSLTSIKQPSVSENCLLLPNQGYNYYHSSHSLVASLRRADTCQ